MPTPNPGVLSRYVDLIHRCRERVVEEFTQQFRQFQEELPDILVNLADQAESNVLQAHCMDVRQEVCDHRNDMVQQFYNELMAGFERFILGQQEPDQGGKTADSPQHQKRLSLVEKETFEIELAFDSVANSACVNYSEQLNALNHRLAVINGGHRPGERSSSLPGGPHHACNAYRAALSMIQIPIDTAVKISLIEAFDKHILRQAEPVYQQYNQLFIEAGVLPNLEESPIYTSPDSSGTPTEESDQETEELGAQEVEESPSPGSLQGKVPPPSQPPPASMNRGDINTQEERVEQEIFQNISELLHQRRGIPHHTVQPPEKSKGLDDLIATINRRSSSNGRRASVPQDIATYPLEQIRAEFSSQVAQLAELIKQHHVEHTDADVIELVGMLFELVLNDPNLPDSVKALLSHLHTPYLKVALLDRKFFFKRRHPARRLLNTLTQAGALCNASEKNEQVVFTRMRETVNQILTEFDDNIELFDSMYEEFEEFLRTFQQRARMLEKRAIEKAKGQERLREARQTVARELITIIDGRPLPKAAEKLLFGPWSNLLVLLYLRKGADSEIRQHYLQVTEKIIWSVEPKSSPREQYELRHQLGEIKKAIQEGLALLGDPESSAERLLNELGACHQVALASTPESIGLPEPAAPPSPEQYPLLQELDPEELSGPRPHTAKPSPKLEKAIRDLQKIKLGTWFELENKKTGIPLRAKLSWFSPKTSYYIFVNQAGIQVAVKPMKKLAREISEGNTKILELEKKPFVERALKRIYNLLSHSGSVN